jgi:hypothetical protein
LAFAFVTLLLETKAFATRAQVAAQMEVAFLQRYFGTNADVLTYAKKLILARQRQAAKALNDLVDVMGSDVEAPLLIARIEEDFDMRAVWTRLEQDRLCSVLAGHSNENLRKYQNLAAAVELVEALGYRLGYSPTGLFKDKEVVLTAPNGEVQHFRNDEAFRQWALKTLC